MYVRLLLIAVFFTFAVALSGCAGRLEAPEQVVQDLLVLQSEGSSDASAYARVLADSSVATALASAAQADTGAVSPIPQWSEPYISSRTTSTAEVVVVWRNAEDYPKWSAATIFSTELIDGRWVAVDAIEVEGDSIPRPAK